MDALQKLVWDSEISAAVVGRGDGIVLLDLEAPLADKRDAAVMVFDRGGIVPGVGKVDIVPAMLTPGEGGIPKPLMDGLQSAARTGDVSGSQGDVHVHHHAVYNFQAFDSRGVDKVLQKHSEKFTKHLQNELRKRNM